MESYRRGLTKDAQAVQLDSPHLSSIRAELTLCSNAFAVLTRELVDRSAVIDVGEVD